MRKLWESWALNAEGNGDGDGGFVSSVEGVVRGWWIVDSQCAGDGTVNGLPWLD